MTFQLSNIWSLTLDIQKAHSFLDGYLVAKEQLSAEVLAWVGDSGVKNISCICFHVEWQVPDSEHCRVIIAEKLAVLEGTLSNKNKKINRHGKRSDKAENTNKTDQRS